MSQSAEPHGKDAVARELATLEELCAELERALTARDWTRLDGAIGESRRAMHALQNAFETCVADRDAAFDAEVFARLRSLETVRTHQQARLKFYRGAVGERLQLLGRAKTALRSLVKSGRPNSSLASLDRFS
ncbi:MAG: hypothetical protein M3R35_00280 [Candidatus Eremiobacteraeota bacterium]|nr:hypothetical protein [Candidatus Eremiobacteraeota bacterium]